MVFCDIMFVKLIGILCCILIWVGNYFIYMCDYWVMVNELVINGLILSEGIMERLG